MKNLKVFHKGEILNLSGKEIKDLGELKTEIGSKLKLAKEKMVLENKGRTINQERFEKLLLESSDELEIELKEGETGNDFSHFFQNLPIMFNLIKENLSKERLMDLLVSASKSMPKEQLIKIFKNCFSSEEVEEIMIESIFSGISKHSRQATESIDSHPRMENGNSTNQENEKKKEEIKNKMQLLVNMQENIKRKKEEEMEHMNKVEKKLKILDLHNPKKKFAQVNKEREELIEKNNQLELKIASLNDLVEKQSIQIRESQKKMGKEISTESQIEKQKKEFESILSQKEKEISDLKNKDQVYQNALLEEIKKEQSKLDKQREEIGKESKLIQEEKNSLLKNKQSIEEQTKIINEKKSLLENMNKELELMSEQSKSIKQELESDQEKKKLIGEQISQESSELEKKKEKKERICFKLIQLTKEKKKREEEILEEKNEKEKIELKEKESQRLMEEKRKRELEELEKNKREQEEKKNNEILRLQREKFKRDEIQRQMEEIRNQEIANQSENQQNAKEEENEEKTRKMLQERSSFVLNLKKYGIDISAFEYLEEMGLVELHGPQKISELLIKFQGNVNIVAEELLK